MPPHSARSEPQMTSKTTWHSPQLNAPNIRVASASHSPIPRQVRQCIKHQWKNSTLNERKQKRLKENEANSLESDSCRILVHWFWLLHGCMLLRLSWCSWQRLEIGSDRMPMPCYGFANNCAWSWHFTGQYSTTMGSPARPVQDQNANPGMCCYHYVPKIEPCSVIILPAWATMAVPTSDAKVWHLDLSVQHASWT